MGPGILADIGWRIVLLPLVLGGTPPLVGSAPASRELVEAVRRGETAAALRLIHAGADVHATDSRGNPPLVWAGALGDEQAARALLAARAPGAPVALRLAITNGHLPLVRILVAAGAPIDEETPRLAHDPAIEQFLRRSVATGAALLTAVETRRCDAVEELLATGAPPGFDGALHRAVKTGQAACIRALLASGARVSEGTPSEIDLALRLHNLEAVRLMLATKPPAGVIRAALETAAELKRHSLEPAAFDTVLDQMRQLVDASPAPAGAPSGGEVAGVLSRLRTAAGTLAAGAERDRILRAAEWLLMRARAPGDVSEEYRLSLVRLAEAVEARSAPLGDVAAELDAKVEHCRKLGVGMGGSVHLRVITRRGEERVDRWQVFCLLKIYEHAPNIAPEMFPGWSNPAGGSLEPGRYFVWARDPVSKRTTERVLVRLSGQPEVRLDLPVP